MYRKMMLCLVILLSLTVSSFSEDLGLGGIQNTVFVLLQNEFLNDGVTVKEEDGRIIIADAVTFFPEDGKIKKADFAKLDKIVKTLKKYPIIKIEIIGHCADVGNPDGEMKLSEIRAEAVKKYLVSKKATAEGNITVKGAGATEPAAPNDSEANMSKNRRVEIVFVSFI